MSASRSRATRVELVSVLLLLVLGLACGAAWARRSASDTTAATDASDESDVTQPDPVFSPADVVRMQLDALRRFRDDPLAIAQCYSFASPANRLVTGPLPRFAKMVLGGEYRPLVFQANALVGIPNIRGDRAAVLASVVNEDRNLCIYCFYLSKQTDATHPDCWMTDSVIRVPPMDEPPTKGDTKQQPESV
jgi:hypothetical protein